MRRALTTTAILLGLIGCFHNVSLDEQRAKSLNKVAVIVRVLGPASAELPEPMLKGQSPEKLGKQIEKAMGSFEVAERLRSGLISHLPDVLPWNSIVPSVQAESVLGSLLTEDRPVHAPEFDELQKIGVDGVLYIEITKWGAQQDDTSGWKLEGRASLFTLPDHDTLWAQSVNQLGGGPLEGNWLDVQSVRDHLGGVCESAGEALAITLGGTPQTVVRTPALNTPDIEDKGEPPAKMKPVVPFNIPEPDGGHRDAGPNGIDISVPDGGDVGLPTPGK